jgi:hypothetical protein
MLVWFFNKIVQVRLDSDESDGFVKLTQTLPVRSGNWMNWVRLFDSIQIEFELVQLFKKMILNLVSNISERIRMVCQVESNFINSIQYYCTTVSKWCFDLKSTTWNTYIRNLKIYVILAINFGRSKSESINI